MKQRYDKERIEELIQANERESFQLEFKSGQIRQKDALKKAGVAVCAFANISGGTLIFGIREDKGSATISRCPLSTDLRAADISRHVDAKINPPLSAGDFECYDIEAGNGEFYVVVDVFRSARAPHQYDNIYYARRQIQNLAMTDAEIQDIRAGRASVPSFVLFTLVLNDSSGVAEFVIKNESNDPIYNAEMVIDKDLHKIMTGENQWISSPRKTWTQIFPRESKRLIFGGVTEVARILCECEERDYLISMSYETSRNQKYNKELLFNKNNFKDEFQQKPSQVSDRLKEISVALEGLAKKLSR